MGSGQGVSLECGMAAITHWLRGRLLGWAGMLWRLYRDPRVPAWAKLVCFVLAGLYLISPIDVVPEALAGPLGLLDDALLIPLILWLVQWVAPKRAVEQASQRHTR